MDAELNRLIQDLAGELVLVDAHSSAEDWLGLQTQADAIAVALTAQQDWLAAELAQRVENLCSLIGRGEAGDGAAAVQHINDLLSLLQVFDGVQKSDDAAIKNVLARADLFLQDSAPALEAPPMTAETAQEVEDEFLAEIETRVDDLEQKLYALRPPVGDPDSVRAVFREFHTLKGEAGILGLSELSEFYHDIESRIEPARHGRLVLTAGVIEALTPFLNLGRHLLRHGMTPADRENVESLLQGLDNAVGGAGREAVAATETNAPVGETHDEPEDFFAAAETPGAPVEAEAAPEAPVEEETVAEEALHAVTLEVGRLDSLIELVGEVSMIGGHLSQRTELTGLREVGNELVNLARACRSLQDMAAGLRMTAIKPLFFRARRAAYESARQINKRIAVELEGGETQVDRTVIDSLSAALVHLIRNAVDHGIETPPQRRAAGKSPQGRITLRAYRTDVDVILELADDGKGLDLEAIRTKAVQLGRIASDAKLGPAQLVDLIFSSGLSTAAAVSGLSGRGVGMAVVSESLSAVRGRVEIETEAGRGTLFRLAFPAALAAIDGMLVRLGENRLIFPVHVVRETFRVKPDQVSRVEGRGTVVTIRGVVVPVLKLCDYLGLDADVRDEIDAGVLVMIEEGDKLLAVLVDEVLETRQVLIRQLEGTLQDIPDVTGAALLPDQRVALVLDARGLLRHSHVAAGGAFSAAGQRMAAAERKVETVQIGANAVGMIDFVIRTRSAKGYHDHVFAINAFKVREFVPLCELTAMPGAPEGFAGVLLLREKTIPVVALHRLLGFAGDGGETLERIVVVCEFAGQTVGFIVTHVNKVSYISWNEILPPPESGGRINTEYVVGTILLETLHKNDEFIQLATDNGISITRDEVVFVLDFERIVQQVLRLYGDIGAHLGGVQRRKERNRILLVEDSPLIRRQTAAALESAGIEVLQAEDGQTARDLIEDYLAQARANETSIFAYVDLVLSDIEMPRLDGYSLSSFIKGNAELRVLPVLLHSSLTNETMIVRAREVEADGFVPKCDPEELAAQLRKYL